MIALSLALLAITPPEASAMPQKSIAKSNGKKAAANKPPRYADESAREYLMSSTIMPCPNVG